MLFSFEINGDIDDQTQRVILDNKTYEFRFQWNYTMETWTVFISGVGQEPYCSFILTSFSDPMVVYNYNDELPQGSFLAGGFASQVPRIGRYNVGPTKECFFIYVSNTE